MLKEMTLPARIENIPEITGWIDEALEQLNCPMKAQLQIDVAVDEICGNIASYAYPDGPGDVTVQFAYDPDAGVVSISFLDQGIPFNPLEMADPDISLDAENREVGGLGIFLVKKTMDEVRYRFQEGKNTLCLKKKIRA